MHTDLRAVAAADIDRAVADYRTHASSDVAIGFVDDLEAAINHIQDHPLTGSLRFSYELEIPELRSWSLERFPYLIFYVADADRIDIWRVLHAKRDIPTHLGSE